MTNDAAYQDPILDTIYIFRGAVNGGKKSTKLVMDQLYPVSGRKSEVWKEDMMSSMNIMSKRRFVNFFGVMESKRLITKYGIKFE